MSAATTKQHNKSGVPRHDRKSEPISKPAQVLPGSGVDRRPGTLLIRGRGVKDSNWYTTLRRVGLNQGVQPFKRSELN